MAIEVGDVVTVRPGLRRIDIEDALGVAPLSYGEEWDYVGAARTITVASDKFTYTLQQSGSDTLDAFRLVRIT